MIKGLCPSRGCFLDIQNLYKKNWEYSASVKIAACIPVIGVFVGSLAHISLNKKAAALGITKHVNREQKAKPSQKNAAIQPVLNNYYLRAGLVNALLSVAIVTCALAMQIFPPVLGGVLIAGFAIAFGMLACRLCGDRVKKYIQNRMTRSASKKYEHAITEFNDLRREQTEGIATFTRAYIHLSEKCQSLRENYKDLMEDNGQLNDHDDEPLDEDGLKELEERRQYSETFRNKLNNYPNLPEDRSKLYKSQVREIITERMNHHAEMQQAFKAELDDLRQIKRELMEEIKKAKAQKANKATLGT